VIGAPFCGAGAPMPAASGPARLPSQPHTREVMDWQQAPDFS